MVIGRSRFALIASSVLALSRTVSPQPAALIEHCLEAGFHEVAVVNAAAAQSLQRLACAPLQLRHRHAHFVPQHLCPQRRIRRIRRPITRLVPRYQLLDLANVLLLHSAEPLFLCLGRDHAAELARARERQCALFHLLAQCRNLLDDLGHAKPPDRRSTGVTQLALHVFDQARVAVRPPEHQVLGFAQRCLEGRGGFPPPRRWCAE